MKSLPPPRFPYKWCSAWGEDEFGIWLEFALKEITQRMRWINPGRFLMGSPEEEPCRYHYETQHEVTLTKGFWIADTACSQELWQVVMESNPSKFIGAKRPVENVSWDDCGEFLRKINVLVPDLALCLPTEAQWEYSCRAGTSTPFSFGINITPDQVNYNGEYEYLGGNKALNRKQTVEMKSLPPNQWGLYEMHGNVWEWCADWFGKYETGSVINPIGPSEGSYHVLRGGSGFSSAADCRSAARSRFHLGSRYNRNGFRFLRNPQELNTQQDQQASEKKEWSDGTEYEDHLITGSKGEMTMRNSHLPQDSDDE